MKNGFHVHTPPHRFSFLQTLGFCLMTLSLLLMSCSHPRESFLRDAIEEATQDDIMAEWGEPLRSKTSLLHGETVWIYRFVMTEKEMDPSGLKSISGGVTSAANAAASILGRGPQAGDGDKPICFHYLLTFNKSQVLQDWERVTCAQHPL